VEPVRMCRDGGTCHYRYARAYAAGLLGYDDSALDDVPVDVAAGDIFYSPDFSPGDVIEAAVAGLYADWRARGVEITFLVLDLLPILRPEFFPPDSDAVHARWLACVANNADRLICISHAVADETRQWLRQTGHCGNGRIDIGVVHLGCDLAATTPSSGLPPEATEIVTRLASSPSFLMVGTIEPRKGHLQALAAFEELWQQGRSVNLVIVGREGWTHLAEHQRRTIPRIAETLRHHHELGERLFWLRGISDEYLEKVYAACTCLLAPSEGEGFGLPLVEAASHGLAVIARDLPVFREVAPRDVRYFDGLAAGDLARSVTGWLDQRAQGKPAAVPPTPQRTWAETTRDLASLLTGESGT
jgi:glycosyltransferase involved in cell wall biosynthesis